MIVWTEPPRRRGWSGDACERLFLYPHVRMDVDLGCLYVLMSKPECDYCLIDAVVAVLVPTVPDAVTPEEMLPRKFPVTVPTAAAEN